MKKLALLCLISLLAGCGGAGTERYRVGSDSMAPGIRAGTTVTAHPVEPGTYSGRRGEIVVFPKPASWPGDTGNMQVKRVVAVGGDTVACCDAAGRVTVGGVSLDEPYLGENAPLDGPSTGCGGRRFGPVTVPADQVFVLGDTRLVSVDSACNGPIPASSVVATVRVAT